MKNIGPILLISGQLVFGFTFMAMAVAGFKTGKVYHTSGCRPIMFREKPIKFVVWTVCLIIVSLICLAGAWSMAGKILDEM